MLYFPPAKINLGLRILHKRTDGYHAIESVFLSIPIFDALEIVSSDTFHFQYTGVDHIDGDNLCVKAYQAIAKIKRIPPVKMHLHKNIPIGAGLGGGSADATYVLKGLNSQFGLDLTEDELHHLALGLGSDCPFFLKDKPQYVTGRGEIMVDASLDLKGYRLVIVNPGIHISTKEAYQNLRILSRKEEGSLKEIIESPIENWQENLGNDFEVYAFKTYPVTQEIKETLLANGALYASMTGTGSTVYGIFSTENTYVPSFEGFYQKSVLL